MSSAQEDIQKQNLLAEAYINYNHIDQEKVIWLKDEDVSANKLTMKDRPNLQKLRFAHTAKNGQNHHCYNRDRLAYEYTSKLNNKIPAIKSNNETIFVRLIQLFFEFKDCKNLKFQDFG